ncbi:Leucine--tRNA ligase, partial [Clarias magur]
PESEREIKSRLKISAKFSGGGGGEGGATLRFSLLQNSHAGLNLSRCPSGVHLEFSVCRSQAGRREGREKKRRMLWPILLALLTPHVAHEQ